jgi:mannan endo-1,4-beta-mannosidase
MKGVRTKARVFIVSAVLLFYFAPAYVSAASPANSNASPAAKNVLNYLYSLPNRTSAQGKKVISGQYIVSTNPGGQQAAFNTYIGGVNSQTGKWIAMIGSDYSGYSGQSDWWLNPGKNSMYIDYWNKGGLVNLNWWPSNPWTGSPYDTNQNINYNLNDLITPGNAAYNNWISYLDLKATELGDLQNHGVVVLWRPFHEMNGDWWWWANRNQTQFINLYRHMYDYFTQVKGLNNLLWVWGPTATVIGSKTADYYYPGNDVIDIVGVSYYSSHPDLSEIVNDYNTLLSKSNNKPFAINEFGPGAGNAEPANNTYDYSNLIAQIKQYVPKTVYFMPWYGGYAIVNQKNSTGLMSDPWVISRDDLPGFSSLPTPTPTPVPTKAGDANGDGKVDIIDIGIIVDAYGTNPTGDTRADLNGDGVVNGIDIGIVIDNYGL